MVKKLIEFLDPLIVFFSPYPIWAKVLVVVWLLISAILLAVLILVPRLGEQAGPIDAYPKFQTLMAYNGEDSSVSVSLIEDIANSRDPRRKEYLESFKQVRNTKSGIEADATDTAIKAIAAGTKLKNTHETLFEEWKRKNSYSDIDPVRQFVFTVLYLKRIDSETYKSTVDSISKSLEGKESQKPGVRDTRK